MFFSYFFKHKNLNLSVCLVEFEFQKTVMLCYDCFNEFQKLVVGGENTWFGEQAFEEQFLLIKLHFFIQKIDY